MFCPKAHPTLSESTSWVVRRHILGRPKAHPNPPAPCGRPACSVRTVAEGEYKAYALVTLVNEDADGGKEDEGVGLGENGFADVNFGEFEYLL